MIPCASQEARSGPARQAARACRRRVRTCPDCIPADHSRSFQQRCFAGGHGGRAVPHGDGDVTRQSGPCSAAGGLVRRRGKDDVAAAKGRLTSLPNSSSRRRRESAPSGLEPRSGIAACRDLSAESVRCFRPAPTDCSPLRRTVRRSCANCLSISRQPACNPPGRVGARATERLSDGAASNGAAAAEGAGPSLVSPVPRVPRLDYNRGFARSA